MRLVSGEKRGKRQSSPTRVARQVFFFPLSRYRAAGGLYSFFFSLQLEYYVLLFKVFFRCPHKRLDTCQHAHTNETRRCERERVSLCHRTRKKKTHPEKHPCTTRRRERDSITNALGSGKATGPLQLRLNSDADHPGRQKRRKKNKKKTSELARRECTCQYSIYVISLSFFGSTPCLSRHGFFFTFCFLKTLHLFYKKLSGRGTNRHLRT